MRVRDRCWLWGHEAGSHNDGWGLPRPSSISAGEAAAWLGVPNVIMVRYGERFDAEAEAAGLAGPERVVWSIVGAAGRTGDAEVERARELAARDRRWQGVMMDDFFRLPSAGDPRLAAYTPAELQAIRARLATCGRPLDLWVVLYDHQLDLPVREHLEECDVVTFWTWLGAGLSHLEENLERLERIAPPRLQKLLGCYMWDYGARQPMPVEAMEAQCEAGLRRLREGRLDGLVFLASCICDVGLETVAWTRDWIRRVGELPLA